MTTAAAAGSRSDSESVVLPDGSTVRVRQLERTDERVLVETFAGMSPASRYLRFLVAKTNLSTSDLHRLTAVDHWNHEALVALDPQDGRGIGVVRYIRSPDNPASAEIAIEIADGWQRRGLGIELLRRLSRLARAAGVEQFTGLAASENGAIPHLIRRLALEVTAWRREGATVEFTVTVPRFLQAVGSDIAGTA